MRKCSRVQVKANSRFATLLLPKGENRYPENQTAEHFLYGNDVNFGAVGLGIEVKTGFAVGTDSPALSTAADG